VALLHHRELAQLHLLHFLEEPGVLARMNEALWSLPEVSDSVLLAALPCMDDYDAFARRGLYAFDWADSTRTTGLSNRYELYARPTTPVRFTDLDLPVELRQLIAAVTAPSLDFTKPSVDVRHLDCIVPDA
jgi:hypothetical protein